jgi:hypothetical protein
VELDELKSVIKGLSLEERRKLAMYILELEKNHLQATLGPQIAEDIDGVSRVLQDAVEKIKKSVKSG